MRIGVIIFITFLLVFIQFSLPANYSFKFFIPNIILVFLACAIFYLEFEEMILYIVIVGFLLDASSTMPWGIFLMIYLIIGSVLYFLKHTIHEMRIYSALIFSAVATIIFYFLVILLLPFFSFITKTFSYSPDIKHLLINILPANLIANLILSLFFFFFVRKLFDWLFYYKKEVFK